MNQTISADAKSAFSGAVAFAAAKYMQPRAFDVAYAA
jgi:hypothetical protein